MGSHGEAHSPPPHSFRLLSELSSHCCRTVGLSSKRLPLSIGMHDIAGCLKEVGSHLSAALLRGSDLQIIFQRMSLIRSGPPQIVSLLVTSKSTQGDLKATCKILSSFVTWCDVVAKVTSIILTGPAHTPGWAIRWGTHTRAENIEACFRILPQHVILDFRDFGHKVCHLERLRLVQSRIL